MDKLDRLKILIGKENIIKIKNTTIMVIGCGGVGSFVIESLVRSGIGTIIIVDFDKIDVTNLNRQVMTSKNNIGLNKVDVLENRIRKISDTKVIKINERITLQNIDSLFNCHINYFVDACDDVEIKKEIIRKCLKYNINLISSMGTGNKLDPTKLEITDIRKTSYDPIAKIIRKMVKSEKINHKIMVVSSKEKPLKRDNIGSSCFVPATAGLLIASYIINSIIGEIC